MTLSRFGRTMIVFFLLSSLVLAATQESVPKGLKIETLEVWPKSIQLNSPLDDIQLLITGRLTTGEQLDLTRMVKLGSWAEQVSVSPTGIVRAKSNGQGSLSFTYENLRADVPVSVAGTDKVQDVSFVRDVAPTLSKLGCNSGTCHGSKDGQYGFKLSLRGYDFLYDHRALTDDIGSRRFNRAAPDQSLMLLKASGSIAHVGGQLTKPGEANYQILRSWIANGCKLDLDAPRVTRIELLPENPIVPRAGVNQQMVVLATYADGSQKDVTSKAFIESGNIEILAANRSGLVSVLRRGEAPVLARFEGAYTATTITIMGDRSGFEWKETPTNNYIDELVYDKLKRVKILPSGLCTDSEFVRRVYLDLTGLPPTSTQTRAFLADETESQAKRNALIDQLIGSPDYVEHWTNKWADMLQVNRKFLGEVGATSLRDWIKDRIASNEPYDKIAHEVITASGSTMDNPASAYWKILREPAAAMENTTHLFLGVRFNCNKCHDHPFERWTQDQYYNLTAYFAQIGRKEDPDFAGQRIGGSAVESAVPLVEVVFDSNSGDTIHDRTGEIVSPSFPYEDRENPATAPSRRRDLASWITSPKNRYFASSYVNRLWGYLLGVGLIEPIDDIRAGNPPTNPELLQAMTKDFVDSGFDVQHILRTICQSRAYQHSVQTNEWNHDDTINYSHGLPRRLPAEVLFDAIHVATGSETHIPGVPDGFRAAELPDVGVKLSFLDDFGRPVRESSCECERSSGVVLGPIMKLINGPTVSNAVADGKNAISALVSNEKDDRKVIDELFVRFLSREPTAQEIEACQQSFEMASVDKSKARASLDALEKDVADRIADWEKSQSIVPQWTNADGVKVLSDAKAKFEVMSDGSILVSATEEKDVYTVSFGNSGLKKLTGLRIEAMADDRLPKKGPGLAKENGNFVINEVTLEVDSKSIQLGNPSSDFDQSGWDVKGIVDGNATSGWAIAPQVGKNHFAIVETSGDVILNENSTLTLRLSQQHGTNHMLGRFRISLSDSERPLGGTAMPKEIEAILAIKAESRSKDQIAKLRDHYLSENDTTAKAQLEELRLRIEQSENYRLTGAQDLAWALINNPAFLFNR